MSIAVSGQNLENALTYFEYGNVECSTTEVENSYLKGFAFFVQSICKRCGCWLVKNALNLETGYSSRIFRSLPLGIIKVCWNGYHSFFYSFSEVGFSILFQFLQNHCGYFWRGEFLVHSRDVNSCVATGSLYNFVWNLSYLGLNLIVTSPHKPLYGKDGIFRVCYCLSFGGYANEPLPFFCESDYRWRYSSTFSVWDYRGLAAFHYSHAAVCGSEIYSQNFRHCHHLLLVF